MYLETTQRERLLFLQNKNLKTNPDEIINKRNKNFKSKFFFLCVQCIKMSKFKLDYDEDTLRNCIKYFYNLACMEHRNAFFLYLEQLRKIVSKYFASCRQIRSDEIANEKTVWRLQRNARQCGFFRCNVNVNVKAKKKCFA